MTDLARIEVDDDRSGLRLVRVRGEIDISNARELEWVIERAMSNGSPGLILDLSHTRYLDSGAIELLFRLAGRLQARRLELKLVVPPGSPIRAVLELTGLPRAVTLEEGVDAPSPD